MSVEAMRDYAFRTVPDHLNYRGSPLSVVSRACAWRRRLPWVKADDASAPVSMTGRRGSTARPRSTRKLAPAARLELLQWPGRRRTKRRTETRALYLLRPDTYVALVDANADPATVERYFAERGSP